MSPEELPELVHQWDLMLKLEFSVHQSFLRQEPLLRHPATKKIKRNISRRLAIGLHSHDDLPPESTLIRLKRIYNF
jgi:hypothetical protein